MTTEEMIVWGILLVTALCCWCMLGYAAHLDKMAERPCAWCDKEQGVKRLNVSHGICERHQREVLEELELPDQDP